MCSDEELQGRKGWLRTYGGMRVLGDVTPDRVSAFVQDRWDWSGMGMEIGGSRSDFVHVIRSADLPGLTDIKKATLIGYVEQRALGLDPRLSDGSTKAYNRFIRKLGLSCDGSRLGDFAAARRRLDFLEGREVLCA